MNQFEQAGRKRIRFARWALPLLCLGLGCGMGLGAALAADPPNKPAAPVGVDLRKLPAPAPRDRPPKEAPAPGIPDYRPHLVRDAKLDLGRRLGIDISEIELRELASATWPDLGLGCPRPGQTYGQMMVPGYRMTLSAGGRDYIYHTDSRNRVVLCSGIDP